MMISKYVLKFKGKIKHIKALILSWLEVAKLPVYSRSENARMVYATREVLWTVEADEEIQDCAGSQGMNLALHFIWSH
jgi:hypothetical protein